MLIVESNPFCTSCVCQNIFNYVSVQMEEEKKKKCKRIYEDM